MSKEYDNKEHDNKEHANKEHDNKEHDNKEHDNKEYVNSSDLFLRMEMTLFYDIVGGPNRHVGGPNRHVGERGSDMHVRWVYLLNISS